jgi:hypothetical protein
LLAPYLAREDWSGGRCVTTLPIREMWLVRWLEPRRLYQQRPFVEDPTNLSVLYMPPCHCRCLLYAGVTLSSNIQGQRTKKLLRSSPSTTATATEWLGFGVILSSRHADFMLNRCEVVLCDLEGSDYSITRGNRVILYLGSISIEEVFQEEYLI